MRQPLARLWLALPGGRNALPGELLRLIADEVNVKSVRLLALDAPDGSRLSDDLYSPYRAAIAWLARELAGTGASSAAADRRLRPVVALADLSLRNFLGRGWEVFLRLRAGALALSPVANRCSWCRASVRPTRQPCCYASTCRRPVSTCIPGTSASTADRAAT